MIGMCFLGKDVIIECSCEIGDHVLIANRVAIVGRRDHVAPYDAVAGSPACEIDRARADPHS